MRTPRLSEREATFMKAVVHHGSEDAISAYETFDRRGEGWIKTVLTLS
jgi:threonine dehydrogenase-like Zn-dependent dehydrogenase